MRRRTTEPFRKAVGANLRACRVRAGLANCDLSLASGVGRNTISELELGKRGMSLETACRLAAALGATVAELVPRVTPAGPAWERGREAAT